jgi:hypothetical protein
MKAHLSPQQDARWETLFAIAVGDGLSDDEADAEAWTGICEEWPTLSKYSGAEP